MNRKDVIKRYETVYDRLGGEYISSSGKYEGEQVYVPALWDATLDGCAEELAWQEDGCGEYVCLLELTPEDIKEWPELDGFKYASLAENSIGFVSCLLIKTEEEAEQFRKAFEEQTNED
jgi:hypothetical protein